MAIGLSENALSAGTLAAEAKNGTTGSVELTRLVCVVRRGLRRFI